MTKQVTVTHQGKKIIVGVGGQIRTLDFKDGYATLSVSDKDTGEVFLNIEFTNDVPLPVAKSNTIDISMALPTKSTETEETNE